MQSREESVGGRATYIASPVLGLLSLLDDVVGGSESVVLVLGTSVAFQARRMAKRKGGWTRGEVLLMMDVTAANESLRRLELNEEYVLFTFVNWFSIRPGQG